MKSNPLFFLFVSAILFIAFNPHGSDKYSSQAPLGRTGAPGETTCGSCHSGGSYNGSMVFQLSDASGSDYLPGETYIITFTGNYSAPRYGFSITALDEGGNSAGDFTLINENNTSLGTLANGRQYVGQKNADATNEWTFSWTAPTADAGPITFYYVINAANGDGGRTGDYVATGSTSIKPADVTRITDMDKAFTVSIFPNPVTTLVNIRSTNGTIEEVLIFDMQGKLVRHALLDNNELSVDVSSLNSAVYLLQARTSEQVSTHRIIVQH